MKKNSLLEDIVYCKYNNPNLRKQFIRPALLTLLFTLACSIPLFMFLNYSVRYVDVLTLSFSVIFFIYAIKKWDHNVVYFIIPLSFYIVSLHALAENHKSELWVYYQLFSILLINFLGTTRCSVITFLFISLTPFFGLLLNIEPVFIIEKQFFLYVIFPINLANSFYKSKIFRSYTDDVKHIQKLEGEIKIKNAEANTAELVSVISHEVNNSLTILDGSILLAKMKHNIPEDAFKGIEKASEKINKIIKLAKKKSFISEKKERFNLSDLINDEVKLYAIEFKGFDIFIKTNVENNIFIEGNVTEYSLVISNLLNNAKDALVEKKEGSKEISLRLYKDENQNKILSVKDNANGIPKEKLDLIFDKSFTTKERGKGAGLGLYFIKSILDSDKNTIEVDSNNNGTNFQIIFSNKN